MHRVLQTLLAHNEWATRALIERCRELSEEDYRRDFEIGLGSLERTLAHVVDCMYYLSDGLRGVEYQERADLEEGRVTPNELLEHLERSSAELTEAAAASDFESEIEFPLGSGRVVPRHAILAQVIDHGSHHRSQCTYILKTLGQSIEVHPLRWIGVD